MLVAPLTPFAIKDSVYSRFTEWEELDAFQGYFYKSMLFFLAFRDTESCQARSMGASHLMFGIVLIGNMKTPTDLTPQFRATQTSRTIHVLIIF